MKCYKCVSSLLLAALIGQGNLLWAGDKSKENSEANREIVKMLREKKSEEVILDRINNLSVPFDLSVNALIELKSAGVTDLELRAILNAHPVAPAPSPKSSGDMVSHVIQIPKIVIEPKPAVLGPDAGLFSAVPTYDDKFLITMGIDAGGSVLISADGHVAAGAIDSRDSTQGVYRFTDHGERARLDSGQEPGVYAVTDINADGSAIAGTVLRDNGKHLEYFVWDALSGFHIINNCRVHEVTNYASIRIATDLTGAVASYTQPNDQSSGWWGDYQRTKNKIEFLIPNKSSKANINLPPKAKILGANSGLQFLVGVAEFKKSKDMVGFFWEMDSQPEFLSENFYPRLVSEDGVVVFGTSEETGGHVIRWTRQKGREDLGTFGGVQASVSRISPDGSSVVGWFLDKQNQTHIYRWSAARGVVDLGITGAKPFQIRDVSADGSSFVAQVHDKNVTRLYWVPFADLATRRAEKASELQNHRNPAEDARVLALAQEQEKRNAAALQERVNRVLDSGLPADLYTVGTELETAGYAPQAAEVYRFLLSLYPTGQFSHQANERLQAVGSVTQR